MQGKKDKNKNEEAEDKDSLRLNRYLSNAGVCSRRDADDLIKKGLVSVNGVVVSELGVKVKKSDKVEYLGKRLLPESKVYILMNKPRNVVTTLNDPQNRRTILDLLRGECEERIYPVGRLDRNTTGLLMLTNDGELAAKLTHPSFGAKKIYHVTADKKVSKEDIQKLKDGFNLEDGFIQADEVEYVLGEDSTHVGIELHSGKNRIVRRMFAHLGYNVEKLDRVYFAGLTKKNLKRGWSRHLTQQEVNLLKMGNFK